MDYYMRGTRTFTVAQEASDYFNSVERPAIIRETENDWLVVTLSPKPIQHGQMKWSLTSAEEYQCDNDMALAVALHQSRHFNARKRASAFAGLVASDVSPALGKLLRKWVEHGMTINEMLARLHAAIEQADRTS